MQQNMQAASQQWFTQNDNVTKKVEYEPKSDIAKKKQTVIYQNGD